MKKKLYLLTIFTTIFCFNIKDTYAFDKNNYVNRNLCGNFEVSGFHTDGYIDKVACFSNYNDAKNFMKNNGAEDLAIMTKVNGQTKIIDANVDLVDLSGKADNTIDLYPTSEANKNAYTYMNPSSKYGGVDAAHLETAYSNALGQWTTKIRIGNFTGWAQSNDYELVPITWIKSSSTYTITNDYIRHNYTSRVQDNNSSNKGSTIGPKPTMLSTGTYYSFDGHYFYNNLRTLIKDYKNGNFNNSVNKNNVYYNYYMYLSNHTKTTYSSINIDEYTRNNLGVYRDEFGIADEPGASRFYGKGAFFYYAQQKYGVNALLTYSLSKNETASGTSSLAINKNNGFGLNAVDSSPGQSANWYGSFSSSILGYASKWVTYGYAHPKNWRYFGPQFGDKWIGMNVKYASDSYWSEKMASNYYSFDKAKGLQDYNYYQLGVANRQINAMSDSNNSSKLVYSYPEKEDGMVIIGEKTGETIDGNNKWYKVVSDLNIDSNYNEITSGNFNWNGYVYVPAAYVTKINTGKNGYISPNSVTEYQDSDYSYDLRVEDTVLKPLIGYSTKDTSYYYDPTLQSKINKNLLKDRYVMIYSRAYDKNNNLVAYLVTSDYMYDQKEWVSADSITIKNGDYAKVKVSLSTNEYTWVNYNMEDKYETKISGLYSNSYIPVLGESKDSSDNTWYKVPVNLSGTSNQYGYTLASAPNVELTKMSAKVLNNAPVIEANNLNIIQGTTFDPKKNVTANDQEDGNLTDKIKITNNVDINKIGTYKVIYEVTDKSNQTTTKEITVTVTENKKPVINAKDIEVIQGRKIDELKEVTATDTEDGILTDKIEVEENTTDLNTPGTYKIVYKVIDSYKQTTTKEIKVIVIKDESPEINATDKILTQGDSFNELKDVTAKDKEDGNLTDKIEVVENTLNTKKTGEYKITYKVIDSYKNETTKTIKITVVENQLPVITAEDKVISQSDSFNELDKVVAKDKEDGDITKNIKVIENNVNTKELGTYKVIYQVTDSFGNKVEKEIKVTVEEKKLEERDGEFYLDNLKWNKTTKKYTISGYLIILNTNNNANNIKYELILKNSSTNKEYKVNVDSWTKDVPYELGSENGKSYSNSWFKGTIDISSVPAGDYDLYMKATKGQYYTDQVFTNLFNQDIDKRAEDSNKGYNFKVLLSLKSKKVILNIRDGNLITTSTANTFRNMVNDYEDMKFVNNQLNVIGTSYNYDGTYYDQSKITRKLILENTTTYKQYTYNIGSTNKGNYKVTSTDNKDKSYAWYNSNIDIKDLPKGTYSMIVYTKTSDSEDYGEINDIFASPNQAKTTINDKSYEISVNKEKQNRIELIVK